MATETRDDAAKDEGGKPTRKRTSPPLFVRQVVGELRKVIWPTRRELLTYTMAALVFVLVMIGIVAGLDYGFQKLVFLIFG